MNLTKSLCVATCFGTILLGGVVVSHLQAAAEPFTCPLDTNNAFLGKPVCDVQKTGIFNVRQVEVDGRKMNVNPVVLLEVAKDGSILLFWDEIDKGFIYVKRSEDGGKTWDSPITVGQSVESDHWRSQKTFFGRAMIGGSMTDETTGDVLLFNYQYRPVDTLFRSRDHGKTWAKGKITIKEDKNGYQPTFNPACDPGTTLKHGPKKGRLLMPARVFVGSAKEDQNMKYFDQHYTSALYSDDHGKTWTPSEPFPLNGTGESGLVEMLDGSIYHCSRTHTRPGNKRIAWSYDGGETWEGEYEDKYLPDGPPDVYGCNSGLVRLPIEGHDVLIFSSPKDRLATQRNTIGQYRRPIAVRASFDGGKTWPLVRTLPDPNNEMAGYTQLVVGRPGTPSEGMIYLKDQFGYFVRFNLAWMLEKNEFVEPTYIPSEKQALAKPNEEQFGITVHARFTDPIAETSGKGQWQYFSDDLKPVIILELQQPATIDHVVLMEELADGQNIQKYRIDAMVNGSWKQLVEGQTVGPRRIHKIEPVKAERLRFICHDALEMPAVKLRSFAVFMDSP